MPIKILKIPIILIFLLGIFCSFSPLSKWRAYFPPLNTNNKYALEAEYLYRFTSEIPQVKNQNTETSKEKKEPYLKWKNFGDAFRVAVLEADKELYENVAYVLSYHGRIEGKRVEVEQFKNASALASNLETKAQAPPRWQMVFIGEHQQLNDVLRKHFEGKNTLLVSVAPEPIELPNTPENYEKITQVISGKLQFITDLYKKAPEDHTHIRFYSLKLAKSSVPSPNYLIFKLNTSLLAQSAFEHIDALINLRNIVFKTAQDNLLLSKENIINVTGFSVQQKDSIENQKNKLVKINEEITQKSQEIDQKNDSLNSINQRIERQKKEIENQRNEAIAARNEAEFQKTEAIIARNEAEKQKKIAEDTAKYALKQKTIADALRDKALEQTKIAQEQTKIAQEQTKLAQEQTRKTEKALNRAKMLTFSLAILGILTALLIGIFLYFRFRLIRKSKKESEALLLSILPPAIVKELKDTGKTVMRKYERVSVLFTDFKGFSEITKNMTADEMIEELNDCFTNFDEIINKYGIERIKTIGDAYMSAGGLPEVNYHHPVTMTLAALEMQRFMKRRYEERDGNYWMCRLGLNVGAVRAGVVGTSKFAYDLWGNAVNIAARLESAGEVYKVNTNESTYQLIKDFFDAEYRGEIKVKHGLVIPMYFITGIKPKLSENGDGITPNVRFQQMLKNFETNNQEDVRRLEELDKL